MSQGNRTILLTIVISAVFAALFPRQTEDPEGGQADSKWPQERQEGPQEVGGHFGQAAKRGDDQASGRIPFLEGGGFPVICLHGSRILHHDHIRAYGEREKRDIQQSVAS